MSVSGLLPRVSILIPCYNAEKWIAHAIQSALDQTYANKEVIVVDDGSTDSSLQVIRQFEGKIIFESGPNQGGNVARNRLLKLSTGDWLQYLDADDYLLPTKIEKQVGVLDQGTDVVYSPSIIEYHSENVTRVSEKIVDTEDPFVLLAKWRLPQTGGPLWRKTALVDVRGWKDDQPVCQEHELYLRLLMAGKKFTYFENAESVYRQWSNNTLWKKDQTLTRRHRLIILQRLEDFLSNNGLMTSTRQLAINLTRFEEARMFWLNNPQEARSIIKKINETDKKFIPTGRSAPLSYRLIYNVFGFSTAERIAQIVRTLKKY